MSLPAEVIHHIFSFLSPCEIVRLRQVSKKFCDVTHGHTLWTEVYANARFLLPPGPFSWQSDRYLERTLVQSELASKTWTSQPLKMQSRIMTSWNGESDPVLWTVVWGRWCIFLEGKMVQCHDIDSDTYYTLYDGTAHPRFWFTAYTPGATDIDGRCVYLLLVDMTRQEHELRRLLAFRVNDDGLLQPEIIMDCTRIGSGVCNVWESTREFYGSAPFITVRRRQPCLVLDLRTSFLYRLPVHTLPGGLANGSQLHAIDPPWSPSNEIILTKTHVIRVRMYTGESSDTNVLIQAFIIPDLPILHDRNQIGELCLTHEVTIHTSGYLRLSSLLRNSIVSPATGSVNIRLFYVTGTLNISTHNQISCLDLTLPKPVSNADILPISVRSQHLFELTWTFERHTVSDDGYVRGLVFTEAKSPDLGPNSVQKFTIDASGEECTMTISDPGLIHLPTGIEADYDIAFDGTRGRIHYFKEENNLNQVVTVNLA
ncbi:hypothetical protein L210DRAFT_3759737 [Boletus edulis BED1]|uniref:F-box domain-containing protein n=1 Tax=Boletus edulis BED1 TaxID=1328754 RepID=A0AAD4GG38_BOLED|nr:hypothetical protein L210DRAFT_3759737 [Boletus edulis BED1]